jgi:hypothetical protein
MTATARPTSRSRLAWWTDRDRHQTDRLFRQSGLYRKKWERDDYRERTLDKALEGIKDGHDSTAAADGATAATVPASKEMLTEIEAGERSYGDDSSARDLPGGAEKWCSSVAAVTRANLAVDDSATLGEATSELTNREAAAHVWQLVKVSDQFHVPV